MKKLLLVSLSLLVVLVADYLLFANIRERTASVNAIVDQNNTLIGEESQTSSFKTLYEDSSADRASLDSFILAKSNQVAFVGSLGSLANTSGATLTISGLGTSQDLSPSDPASAAGVQFLNASLKVQGTWTQVTHFLALIESLPYSLSVDTLELEKDTANAKASQWDGTFTIHVLTYDQ